MKKGHQTFRIEETLKNQITKICKTRPSVSEGDIINTALQEFFFPSGDDKREAEMARHILRVEKQIKELNRNQEILGEAFSLFVKIWLTNTMELSEEQKEIAERAGGRRFKKYMDVLGSRLQSGKSITDYLPQDVYFKADAFHDLPQGGDLNDKNDSNDKNE